MASKVIDIDEVAKYKFPFPHPETVDITTMVHKFSAVIGKNKNLINSGDYISYFKESEVSQHFIISQ